MPIRRPLLPVLMFVPLVALAQPAPPLVVEHVRNAPGVAAGDLLPRLKGKPAVLEFWTTWCAPCIAAMPKLRQLEQQYAGKVQFVSLNYEDPKQVDPFLRRRTPAGWVALDTDNSVFEAYGITSYPTTMLLTAEGQVIRLASVNELTSQVLDELLAGTLKPNPTENPFKVDNEDDLLEFIAASRQIQNADPSPIVKLKPSKSTRSMTTTNVKDGMYMGMGVPLMNLYAVAYDVQPHLVRGDSVTMGTRWWLQAKTGNQQVLQTKLAAALDSATLSNSHKVVRKQPVLELRLVRNQKLQLRKRDDQPDQQSMSTGDGTVVVRAQPVSNLVEFLSKELRQPVLDETKLEGLYDYDLTWDHTKGSEMLKAALREQLGLELVPMTREVALVEVTKRQ